MFRRTNAFIRELTSYLYVGGHYKKNNGVSSKLASVSIVTLWIQVVAVVQYRWSDMLMDNEVVSL
jgi:hypothetical protein